MRQTAQCIQATLIATLALASGCTNVTLAPGADMPSVRAALGEPAAIHPVGGGETSWEYPGGPLGTRTFLARFDASGKLASYRQVLTDDNLNRITTGMTSADVRALIGPPYRTVAFDNLGQIAWDYLVQDTWGYRVEFSVMIDPQGFVRGKVSRRLNDGRDSSRD